jgi:hypothetical protein
MEHACSVRRTVSGLAAGVPIPTSRRPLPFLGLSSRGLRILLAILAVGTSARLALAFATYGVQYDIDSARIVTDALQTPGVGPYPTGRWPYPPGFFPLLLLADAVADATGLPFHGVVQLPAIAADAVLAVLVAGALRAFGRTEAEALAGAGLVALGPSFAIISGYHGQIDSVAILPAAAAAVVWVRGGRRRALTAGLLIGLGAAVKTVPFFVVLVLLPTARDRREALTLLGCAMAVPAAAVAPWLAMDPGGTLDALRANHGVPGFGGLSAFLQPQLTRYWSALDAPPPPIAPAITAVTDVQNLIVGAAVLAVAAMLALRRAEPLAGLAALWMCVLAVNPNFAYQYVVWALPFLLLAGLLRETALLQAALLAPALLLYSHADKGGWTYWVLVQLAWLVIVAIAARRLRSAIATAPVTAAAHSPTIHGT